MSQIAVNVKVVVTKERLMEIAKETLVGQDERTLKLIEEITDLVLKKNADYGDAWQRYGIFTPLVRLNDKMLRVANLSDGKPALVADESITVTLMDTIGYSLLALLYIKYSED